MQTANMDANTITFKALIAACANGKQTDEALGVYDWMQTANVDADIIMFNTLIAACANGKQTDEALRVHPFAQRESNGRGKGHGPEGKGYSKGGCHGESGGRGNGQEKEANTVGAEDGRLKERAIGDCV